MKITKEQIEKLNPCKEIEVVKVARNYLVKLGFSVSEVQPENANGHDLIAIPDCIFKENFLTKEERYNPFIDSHEFRVSVIVDKGVLNDQAKN